MEKRWQNTTLLAPKQKKEEERETEYTIKMVKDIISSDQGNHSGKNFGNDRKEGYLWLKPSLILMLLQIG